MTCATCRGEALFLGATRVTRGVGGLRAPIGTWLAVVAVAFLGLLAGPIRSEGESSKAHDKVSVAQNRTVAVEAEFFLAFSSGSRDRQFEAIKNLEKSPKELRIRVYRRGLRSTNRGVRSYCAFQLGSFGYSGVSRELGRLALIDPDPEVRANAARGYGRLAADERYAVDDHSFIQPFIAALSLPDPHIRIRAAEALGLLGQMAAVPALVSAFQGAGSSAYRAPSNHIFIGNEKAIVTDFDVEIARAAVIADPKISHVRSGAQLEMRVLSVEARLVVRQKVVIGRSLEALTGEKFGSSEEMWTLWWETLGREDPRFDEGSAD